jgi:hypothetical protein
LIEEKLWEYRNESGSISSLQQAKSEDGDGKMPSFWKFALFNFLRVIGIICVLIGAFGGLIAYGSHLTNAVILAVFFFVGGILLTWYANFKIHTGIISRGINDAYGWKNERTRLNKRSRFILVGVSVGIIVAILLIASFSWITPAPTQFSTTFPKAEATLYFQSTLNELATPYAIDYLGGGSDFIMNQSFPAGEQKTPDLWHHANRFLSPPLSQNIKISELSFLFYHKITSTEYGSFTVKIMLLNANTGIQTICTGNVTSNQYSRSTTCTITFDSEMPQLLQNEQLYIQIDSGLDWYWGDSVYPSHVEVKGVPQYEEMPLF